MRHFEFVKNRVQNSGALKYTNKYYNCPVGTSQEQFILLNGLKEVHTRRENVFDVTYTTKPQAWNFDQSPETLVRKKEKSYTKSFQLNMLDAQ